MKIKYRRCDDNDYTEVEVKEFIFAKLYPSKKTILNYLDINEHCKEIKNVCEVSMEEI